MAKRKPTYASIGEVSSGTLLPGDLLNSYSWELRGYLKSLRLTRDQRARFTKLMCEADAVDDAETEEAGYILEELTEALEELAPPYSYFGSLEGDGACFGYWPIVDDDELPRYPGITDAAAQGKAHDCYVVNDHGNVTCGHISKRGHWHTYWECV